MNVLGSLDAVVDDGALYYFCVGVGNRLRLIS